MKGLYLSNIDPKQSMGYMSKIIGQTKGFCQLQSAMDLILFNENSQIILTCYENGSGDFLRSKVCSQTSNNWFLRRVSLLRVAVEYIEEKNPDFLYLRYPRSEPLYLYFLSLIRKRFPYLIILSEFPTYPYDKEYEGSIKLKEKVVFFLDKITRQYLKYFFDRIVSINYEKEIFGVNVISIDNGICISDYSPIVDLHNKTDVIRLIGVANVNSWHGYDRVLCGLGQYNRETTSTHPKVVFHIVGSQAPYLDKLLELVSLENIEDFVVFHEPCEGKALDALFADCHLAIGVLGGHRKGIEVMSPLKNREYCARGIPFVFSHIDPDFPQDFQYCLQINSDESLLDIKKIVDFVKQLNNKNDISFKMRNYAVETLNWSVKLAPVKAYIDEQVSKLPCKHS